MHGIYTFAYLDAGTGSVIIQALIGVVLGAVVVLRGRIRQLFDKLTGRTKVESAEEDSEE